MYSASRFSLAALLLAAISPLAFAQTPRPLTLDQAILLATDQSRQLDAGSAQIRAAREIAVSAGQLPDPVLKLGITNLPIDGPDRFTLGRDFMTMRSVAISQEITREGKRTARSLRASSEADLAEANRELTAAALQRDAALAWLERSYLESMRSLIVSQIAEALLQVQGAEVLYRASKGTQTDVFAARSQVELLRDRSEQIEQQIASASAQLTRFIGVAAKQPLAVRPALADVGLKLADLDSQLAHHPQIEALDRQTALAQADRQIAEANKSADWSVELMYSKRGSRYSDMVSLNFSVPLQWDQKNRQDRELSAKLAMVEQAAAMRDDALRLHVAEASAQLLQWQSNHSRLTRYEKSLSPLAEQRTAAALTGYKTGVGALTMVLDARRNEIDVQIDRLRLELETARLWAQLKYLQPVATTRANLSIKATP